MHANASFVNFDFVQHKVKMTRFRYGAFPCLKRCNNYDIFFLPNIFIPDENLTVKNVGFILMTLPHPYNV